MTFSFVLFWDLGLVDGAWFFRSTLGFPSRCGRFHRSPITPRILPILKGIPRLKQVWLRTAEVHCGPQLQVHLGQTWDIPGLGDLRLGLGVMGMKRA